MTEDQFAALMARSVASEGHMGRLPDNGDQHRAETKFSTRVKSYLLDGYGAEDIAVIMGASVRDVRKVIAAWRERGLLAKWFGGRHE